jgi:hypothetical protein
MPIHHLSRIQTAIHLLAVDLPAMLTKTRQLYLALEVELNPQQMPIQIVRRIQEPTRTALQTGRDALNQVQMLTQSQKANQIVASPK